MAGIVIRRHIAFLVMLMMRFSVFMAVTLTVIVLALVTGLRAMAVIEGGDLVAAAAIAEVTAAQAKQLRSAQRHKRKGREKLPVPRGGEHAENGVQ